MKVLVVTGKLADEMVRRRVEESGIEAEVLTLPIEVAALIPREYLSKTLLQKDLNEVKFILLPGLMSGDVSGIGKTTGVETFKGPKNAADLPQVLKKSNTIQLSTIKPACELIKEGAYERALEELKIIYRAIRENRRLGYTIPIGKKKGKIWVGRHLPPVILAEIVDAPILKDEEIKDAAIHYARSGADIIDIGMMAGGGDPEGAKHTVNIVKKAVSKPVSIDTGDVKEMEAAIDAGVDLILSLNGETLPKARFSREITVVITPVAPDGSCPTDPDERISSLEGNIRTARRLGYNRIIADLVLNPLFTPSLTESLVSYLGFARRNPEMPLILGAGNVTELMDADSHGVNLLLAGLGSELQASIFLTTEASRKTEGCVKELSTALKMMLLAKNRGSPPKDLGLNLLLLKDKNAIEEEPPIFHEETITLAAREEYEYTHDPKGYIKILLDRDSEEIQLVHYSYQGKRPTMVIKGKDPMDLCSAAIHRGLVSRLDHAAYIGIELLKAYLALSIGKGYVQDRPLFEF